MVIQVIVVSKKLFLKSNWTVVVFSLRKKTFFFPSRKLHQFFEMRFFQLCSFDYPNVCTCRATSSKHLKIKIGIAAIIQRLKSLTMVYEQGQFFQTSGNKDHLKLKIALCQEYREYVFILLRNCSYQENILMKTLLKNLIINMPTTHVHFQFTQTLKEENIMKRRVFKSIISFSFFDVTLSWEVLFPREIMAMEETILIYFT